MRNSTNNNMVFDGTQSLSNILEPEELQLVPDSIQGKLTTFLEKFSDEYCKERAAANRLGKCIKYRRIYIFNLFNALWGILSRHKRKCRVK